MPQVAGDGRILFCLRERGCTHLYSVAADGAEPRAARPAPVASSAGPPSPAHCCGRARRRRRRTARSRWSTSDRAARRSVTEHGSALRRHRAVRARGARPSRSATAPRCRPGWCATPSARARCRCCVDIHGGPHNAWNAAADEIHLYHQELAARGWAVLLVNPRGSDGYGEEFYDGGPRRLGRGGRRRLPRADRPARRRGARRPGAAGGRRLQLRRLHDLLPHRPRRPVRGRGRRRGRQRPRQHGRHLRRRALPLGVRARRCAVAGAGAVRRDVAADQGRRGADSDARHPRRRRPHAARSARPSSGTRHCASCGVPTQLVLYPDASHVFILLGPPSQRLDFNRRVLDWVEQYAVARRPRHGSTPRTGSTGWRPWRSGTRCPAPSSASCATRRGREDELVEAAYGTAEPGDRRRRRRRLGVPDRLDHQGLDGDGRHAAGRRGPARARHPGRRGAARAAALRPRRHQARHDPAPADPHQRHRRRRLHRHRPRRRLPGEVRRAARRGGARTTRSARRGPTATPASRSSAG